MLTIFISCLLFIISLILLREITVPESTILLKNCAHRLKVSLVVVFTSVLLLLLFVALFYLLTKTGKHTR